MIRQIDTSEDDYHKKTMRMTENRRQARQKQNKGAQKSDTKSTRLRTGGGLGVFGENLAEKKMLSQYITTKYQNE